MQENGSSTLGMSWEEADQIWANAFRPWVASHCDGGGPSFEMFDLDEVDGPIVCDKAQANTYAPNANELLFLDDDWPYDNVGSTIAQTTVTANTDTGEIIDADIEVNTLVFGSQLKSGAIDLQSVLTHESGHFLGLGHSTFPGATMSASYDNETGDAESFRSLSTDDVAAICSVYPPHRNAPACSSPETTNGFSRYCGDDETAKAALGLSSDGAQGCSCRTAAPPANPGGRGLLEASSLVGIFGALRRARRRTEKKSP